MAMTKFTKHITTWTLAVLAATAWVNAGAQTINEVQTSFEHYQQNNLQEKIFVHADKPTYLTGEIMWVKIYDVDGITNRPLDLSKVAYVEVLDNNQSPILQAKIAMDKGRGTGSLYIPISASTGNYKLRAYTNWMKNFSADYYFEKKITIINPVRPAELASASKTPAVDIQFFPEGGNLVSGLKSRIAFRAIGPDAKGVSFRGAIIDQHNDTVARFNPLKFGIGSFTFTPVSGSTYKAVIYEGGKTITRDLPAISPTGYVMQVTDNGQNTLDVTVTNNSGEGGDVYLFAQTRGVVKAVERTSPNSGVSHFTVDKKALGDGISQITIFNSARKPLCERLYFKRPQQQLVLKASADGAQYGIRKKVNVNISAANETSKPLVADMSLSVYRLDSLQKMDEGDIRSYFWLASDLRGNIESPAYYFNNTSAEADQAADNLMLSQGWRRFDWLDVLKDKQPAFTFLPEHNGHIINAKVTDATTGKPAVGIVTYLGIPGKRVQLTTALSDSTGHLLFNTVNYYGAGEIVAEPNVTKDSTYKIDIGSPFSERYTQTPLPAFSATADMRQAVNVLSLGMQVQNIYAGNKIRQFYNPLIDSTAFYGTPYKAYKLDDYTRFTTMEEVLREYVREVFVSKARGHFRLRVVDEKHLHENDPLVLLDGVPVFDIDKVLAIDPLKIKRLEVVRTTYFYGPALLDGVLSFTTYKGDLGGYEIDPKAVVVDYEGMQQERRFYSPVYDTDQQASSRVPDFRNLLYWSPSVATDQSGRAQVGFYTSDETGRYIGVIQGLTANGEAGSQIFTFDVQPGYVAGIKK